MIFIFFQKLCHTFFSRLTVIYESIQMKGMTDMTDAEWFDLIRKFPQKAHYILIDQYSNFVYAIVLSKLKGTAGREDIDDCVSDVFVEIFSNTDKYEGKGPIKNYISIIAKRKAINTYKKIMYCKQNTEYIEDEDSEIPENSASPDILTEQKLFNEKLWETVKSLGEPDTSIIIYQYFYRMKLKKIAEKLSLSATAVRQRSRRAKERIRKKLENEKYL